MRSGLWVDHFDGRWLVQTPGESFPKSLLALAEQHADSLYWRRRDTAASTAPEHQGGLRIDAPFSVEENGAKFRIDFSAGYSPGLFLDQRENRRRVRERSGKGETVLNAFAYTGAFSVMAALGGATTTTLDLSRTYLEWAWENFALNDLKRDEHHGCRGDAFEWMRTFRRQGRGFHGVILDPPTFSRHRKKTFRTDRDYEELASLAGAVVEPGGWLLCCANTHRLPAKQFERQVLEGIRKSGRRVLDWERKAMPPEFRGDDYLKSVWVDVG